MSAQSFFIGLAAGAGMLLIPAVALGVVAPDTPARVAAWVAGPTSLPTAVPESADSLRPVVGFVQGVSTPVPTPSALPHLSPPPQPTLAPPPPNPPPPPETSSTLASGVIHTTDGAPIRVRQAVNVASPSDPTLNNGAPVLISVGATIQVGGTTWQAVRGLGGILGWVPAQDVAVDTPGSGPALAAGAASPTGATPIPVPTTAAPGSPSATAETVPSPVPAGPNEVWQIGNTDGQGVVFRASPRMDDRTTHGLMDGATVLVLQRAGPDWAYVRAQNGAEGWIPTQYLVPVGLAPAPQASAPTAVPTPAAVAPRQAPTPFQAPAIYPTPRPLPPLRVN